MNKNRANIERLIETYLKGNLSSEGVSELIEFIKESHDNLAVFDNYKHNWVPGTSLQEQQKWDNLKSKIIRSQTLDRNFKSTIPLFRKILRVAAVLLIGLILGAIVNSTLFSRHNNKNRALEFAAPKGEKSFVLLSDSTKVWLNGGSMIRMTPNYGWTNRKVVLTGEAYFEVAKDKLRPFIVTTEDVRVKVLGTKFNISAYSDQQEVITTLKEGIIELTPVVEHTFKTFNMQKDQMAVFNRNNSEMRLSHVDVETVIAWKDNQLIINNEHYLKVFKKLGNWYGVSFSFENSPHVSPSYSMKIKTESLREILEIISVITPIDYQIDGNKVQIVFKEN